MLHGEGKDRVFDGGLFMRVIPEEIYSQNTVAVGERACGKTTEKRMEKQSKSPLCQRIEKMLP